MATSSPDTLALEATGGQVQGVFSGTDLWHVNLLPSPAGLGLAPYFARGRQAGQLSQRQPVA